MITSAIFVTFFAGLIFATPDVFEVQIGPKVNYTASSHQLSGNHVQTNVTNGYGVLELSMSFMTNNATVTAMSLLPNYRKNVTWYIPELLHVHINASSIFAFDTVATYVAAHIKFATTHPNSTASRRKLLNGMHTGDMGQDHPGCDDFIDTACTINCCAQHDKCYHDNSCSASSWLSPSASAECTNCNLQVVNCLVQTVPFCGLKCFGHSLSSSVASGGNSCYDHNCNVFYDCPGVCPNCPIPYADPSPPDGCCNCPSPCKSCTLEKANNFNEISCDGAATRSVLGQIQGCCSGGPAGFGTFCPLDAPPQMFCPEWTQFVGYGQQEVVTGGFCHASECSLFNYNYTYQCCTCPNGFILNPGTPSADGCQNEYYGLPQCYQCT
jgi:hypothetical protein